MGKNFGNTKSARRTKARYKEGKEPIDNGERPLRGGFRKRKLSFIRLLGGLVIILVIIRLIKKWRNKKNQ